MAWRKKIFFGLPWSSVRSWKLFNIFVESFSTFSRALKILVTWLLRLVKTILQPEFSWDVIKNFGYLSIAAAEDNPATWILWSAVLISDIRVLGKIKVVVSHEHIFYIVQFLFCDESNWWFSNLKNKFFLLIPLI